MKVVKDCEKTDQVEYHWNITKINPGGGITIIKSISHTITDSALKIPARSLEYGIYGIELKLCMKNVDPTVCSSIKGYIKVNPSLMVAKFVGGSGRAGGKDRMLEVDASVSHDPDESLTLDSKVKIVWSCKRRSEVFPESAYDLPDVTYPEAVCLIILSSLLIKGLFKWKRAGPVKQADWANRVVVQPVFICIKYHVNN